jgi:hypothetical protein
VIAVVSTEIGILELAAILAAVAYVVERILDALGWSRSSRLLRQENEDLLRRDKERTETIRRLESEHAKLEAEVITLRAQVAELTKRDQGAVLSAIETHERNAVSRSERMIAVLGEIRDAVKAG